MMVKKMSVRVAVFALIITVTMPLKQVLAINYTVDGKLMASNAAVLEQEHSGKLQIY